MIEVNVRKLTFLATVPLALAACSGEPELGDLETVDDLVAHEEDLLEAIYNEGEGYDYMVRAGEALGVDPENLPDEGEWMEALEHSREERGAFQAVSVNSYTRDYKDDSLVLSGTITFEDDEFDVEYDYARTSDGAWKVPRD